MKVIVPTINRNSQGEAVSNLQDGLLFLLRRQLIRVADEERRFFEEGLIREQQIQRYDDITQKSVGIFQEQNGLQISGEVDDATAQALNLLFRENGAFNEPETFVVKGTLSLPDNIPVPNITIRAFDRDLRSRELLGQTTTNADGYYEIFYTRKQFSRAEKQTADLIVAAVVPILGDATIAAVAAKVERFRTLAESPTLFNAPAVAEINLTIAADIVQLPSEYARLIQALADLLDNVKIAGNDQPTLVDKLADLNDEDLDFLFHETNIDLEKLKFLAQSARLHKRFSSLDYSVPSPAFYGLARTKRLNDLDSFAQTGVGELIEGLAQAGGIPNQPQQNIIAPFENEEQLNQIAETIHLAASDYVRSTAIQNTVTDLKDSVGDLLQPILNSEEKLESFLDAYARHNGAIEDFWQTMSQNEQFQEDIPRIQLNLQLSQLTLNNKGLVTALQQRDITNTRQLVELSTRDWEALALDHVAEIPAHITGENDVERSRHYAQELETLVEIAFPTDVIKKTIPHEEVRTFLNNNPEFDFTRTPVKTYLHDRGAQALQGIDNPKTVRTQLQRIQRIYTLTANARDANVLMEMKFKSAHQIAKLPADDFVQELSGRIAPDTAYAYHAQAIAVSDTSAMLYLQLRDLTTSLSPKAAQNLRGQANLPPNWRNLFGSLDLCACQHCQSVYSPAAYFVDLLHVLLGQNNGAARKKLFSRRPDLKYTQLSCEHTENLIPYIDLVNEILETYVAQSLAGKSSADDYAAIATNDTSDFSPAELAANPQHPNGNSAKDAKQTYALLQKATFPLNLPFSMTLETARQFLLEQNTSRFEVMAIFGDRTSNATAAERLGVSEREFEILTLKQLDGISDAVKAPGTILLVSDLWGNPTIPAGETLGTLLGKVNTFLDSATIAYTDLLDLLKTRFLNPHFPIVAFLQDLSPADRSAWLAVHAEEDRLAQSVIALVGESGAQCDLSRTKILHLNNQPLTHDELSLFNRFIRLWKKLGCTIPELDAWLTALKATDITPQAIQDISGLWQISQELNLSFEQSAVLTGNIPATGIGSLYAKLFLNKAILQIDTVFMLNATQSELETPESLESHIPGILAALKISQDDLNRIIAYTALDVTADPVNLENLSKIYRYVVLARGMKLSVKDLMQWLDIAGQSPWVSVNELVNVQELLQKIKKHSFKAADFAYLFQDHTIPGNTLLLNDALIEQSAQQLAQGLSNIQQEHTTKNGEAITDFLRRELGILLEPEAVNKIMHILGFQEVPGVSPNFDDLLTLQVQAHYQGILQDYLTPADAADLAATPDLLERATQYWNKIAAKLLPALKKTFIKQHLTAAFKTDANLINFLLQDKSSIQVYLDLENLNPTTLQGFTAQYQRFHKCLWLVGQLKLTAKELEHFQGNAAFDNFNWQDFAFSAWLRIADYAELRNALPVAQKDLLAIFEASRDGGDVVQAIVDVTGWDTANTAYFVDPSGLARTSANFQNEVFLIVLQQQIELSQKIGVSIEKLTSWASDTFSGEQSHDIKRSLKAKFDEASWVEVSTKIHNRLRSQLRNALVAFLLQKPEIKSIGLKNANDLYGYFLIDVEMDACMQTSRLKQAIASVQLFVQRCLLNLETPTVSPKQIDANQWKWMKNYRVWEANRKVFLYPENWIEPELRDNKSPFFKELESELLQSEITNESVEKALTSYLEKLDEVSSLDICGMYEDTEAQNLHVLGRTFNMPPQYFYRQFSIKTKIWSAWQRVQADIQGDAFALAVWNGRLYLFWLVQIQSQTKLAWSERLQERWTPKKISKKSAHFGADRLYVKVEDFKLEIFAVSNPKWENSSLSKVVGASSIDEIVLVWDEFGKFTLESCNGEVSIREEHKKIRSTKKDEYIEFSLQSNVSDSGLSVLSSKSEYPNYDVILGNALSTNKLITQEQLYRLKGSQPFFYQDQYRSYHVEVKKDWLEDTLPSIRNPWKTTISTLPYRPNTVKDIVRGNPASLDTINRFDQLSPTVVNRFVESGQIGTSTAMQIRSVQTLSVPVSKQIQEGNLLVGAGKIGEIYFKPPSILTKVQFKPFFHAYVCNFMKAMNKDGIEGLLAIYNQQFTDLQIKWSPGGIAGGQVPTGVTNNFEQVYRPNKDRVSTPYPIEDVDFSLSGAYSQYNWELFFHVPMLLANRLSKNQRFEEAMRWYHFIFNPTINESLDDSIRFWQVVPFRNTRKETLEELLKQIKEKAGEPKRKDLEDAISAWRNNPFNPHLIARMRLIAYQKNTVMKYLDNLIAWADTLFRQDTIETINQATQLYIIAAELLGKPPEKIPTPGKTKATNYAELEKTGLNALSNSLVKIETLFPLFSLQAIQQGIPGVAAVLNTTSPSMYFCLPHNDKLLGYWDTVADRLFKIRHCQNIEGVERQLALFEPPIDPALLVQAIAGGVDINSVLADLNSPLPYYRFNYILQKALEICAELKSLGNSLLSALEKKDGETLSMMRSQHETMLLGLAKTVKKLQVSEAERNQEGLELTQEVTQIRFDYYSKLISDGLIESEKEYSIKLKDAQFQQDAAYDFDYIANIFNLFPNISISTGAPPSTSISFGGSNLGASESAKARRFSQRATRHTYEANRSSTQASNERRLNEWIFQKTVAEKEIQQIKKQILASQIRKQIAGQELANHEQQLENALQVEDFYRNKYTQEELYGWMVGEISTIYFQCYQLAYDLAKKAEKAYRYELGLPTSNFIQFGIWDSFRKGLMSGERLYLSLKQMEKSYMDQHRREYEITKNISLLLHNPLALITLKETGSCILELPETLFDADYPGHYMRRIKSVNLTIPCVVGPYTSVNCTLTLLSNKTRIKSNAQGNYPEDRANPDNRFITNFAAMQSIATSTAQNDSGMFELNFRDERYLPFEGAGAVSRWRIDLPKDCNAFDFNTISDVILKLNYTAREGGEILKNAAKKAMQNALKETENSTLARLFSAKHEFPTAWHQFLNQTDTTTSLNLDISLQRFPYLFRGKKIEIQKVDVFLPLKEGNQPGGNKTYTDLYAASPFEISLKLANDAADRKPLSSVKSLFNGTPHLIMEYSNNPVEVKSGDEAAWTITVDNSKLKNIQDGIVDLIFVCHYTAS